MRVSCRAIAWALCSNYGIECGGLPTDRFVLKVFYQQKKGKEDRLQALADETRTMVFLNHHAG